jgi:hypothetical protein
VSSILTSDRAARLVEQKLFDATLPGLENVIDSLFAATFGATSFTPYEAEVQRVTENAVIDGLIRLAESASMPQVRAIAALRLQRRGADLSRIAQTGGLPGALATNDASAAHALMLSADIRRFLERPSGPVLRLSTPAAPPGAPIGDPAMEWLRRVDALCSWEYYFPIVKW